MSQRGHIVLMRKFFEGPLWRKRRRFSWAEAWIDLIAEAAWREHDVYVGTKRIRLQRGEICHSVRTLADRWGWSLDAVTRFLRALKSERSTEHRTERGVRLIRLVNYDDFQRFDKPPERQPERPAERLPNGCRTVAEQTETGETRETETTPLPPSVKSAESGGEELVDFVWLRKLFPTLQRMDQHEIIEALDGQNGKTSVALALLAQVCADDSVRNPARVLSHRLRKHEAVSRGEVRRAQLAFFPPQDEHTCECGGELQSRYVQGTGESYFRCADCRRHYPRTELRAYCESIHRRTTNASDV